MCVSCCSFWYSVASTVVDDVMWSWWQRRNFNSRGSYQSPSRTVMAWLGYKRDADTSDNCVKTRTKRTTTTATNYNGPSFFFLRLLLLLFKISKKSCKSNNDDDVDDDDDDDDGNQTITTAHIFLPLTIIIIFKVTFLRNYKPTTTRRQDTANHE